MKHDMNENLYMCGMIPCGHKICIKGDHMLLCANCIVYMTLGTTWYMLHSELQNMYEKVWVLELTLMHVDIVLPYDRAWFYVHKTLRFVFESKGIWFLFDEK